MQKITVEIVRDVWVEQVEKNPDGRLRAGTRMEVDLNDTVLSGIESGAIKRVTPAQLEAEKAKAKK